MKPIIKEFILNAVLFSALHLYATKVLTTGIPFSSQMVALFLMALFIVDAYLNSIKRYGLSSIYLHHLCLGGSAIMLFTVGQFSMQEMKDLGFNFCELEKTGYYQYLLVKSALNFVGIIALPSLIDFARTKLNHAR
ncbi:hypothetical protein [Basfia succiniciproducens]|uniref:hypothetical protein n=1 Tax=Basfia succiniciproducens TaxID=653940 RepID=UPI0008CC2862|nr:hypothetical protein [Basfia succiniciproducens]SEQ65264.1 hypothetical protein SAMN02910415_01831 [Basfia succiniciproducens]